MSDKLVGAYHELGVGFPNLEPVFETTSLTERREKLMELRRQLQDDWLEERITRAEYHEALAKLDLRIEQEPATVAIETPTRNVSREELESEWSELSLDRRRQILRDSVSITVHRARSSQAPLEERVELAFHIPGAQRT
ncbi:hypothetical protein [Pseudonocardia sp. ICBG601]|uniref:hypothetical protein n=1 Tax=Pseudonocardia sp. ICBG601 TaxID=2846759 RepID=UPI001CF635F3|nr:hypothetical protein [Pseudonocardia sp. ICBG601]